MLHLLLAAAISASPSPSATPLRTILHENVSPLCTALRQNIGHAIQSVLADDGAIEASKPIFVAMAHDVESPSITDQVGLGNLYAPATIDHNTAAMQLDTQRIENVIGVLTHNLQLIAAQLNDLSRFPKEPKTEGDRKALEMRKQLEAVAAQQQQTLNVLEGIVDTRNMEAMSDRGSDVLALFGLNGGGNSKISGTNEQFGSGALTPTPDELNPTLANHGALTPQHNSVMDPSLKPSDFSTLQNSVYGRFYTVVYWEQGAIHSLESPLAENVMETTKICNGS